MQLQHLRSPGRIRPGALAFSTHISPALASLGFAARILENHCHGASFSRSLAFLRLFLTALASLRGADECVRPYASYLFCGGQDCIQAGWGRFNTLQVRVAQPSVIVERNGKELVAAFE